MVSCLPGAMADPQTAATGAVTRPPVLHHYALQAGFAEVEILPIHTDYWALLPTTPVRTIRADRHAGFAQKRSGAASAGT